MGHIDCLQQKNNTANFGISLMDHIKYLQQKNKTAKYSISLLGDIDYLQWQQKLQVFVASAVVLGLHFNCAVCIFR